MSKKVNYKYAPGKADKPDGDKQRYYNNGSGSNTGLDQADQGINAGIPPHPFVQVEKAKTEQFKRGNPNDGSCKIC